jgi:predicted aspartyl protease
MSIEFPLRHKQTPFGLISDPKIPVVVRTPTGDRTYYFLIDTGADFAVAPRRVAEQLGLQWATLPEIRVIGIEQGGVRARVGSLPLRLERIELIVRCFFLDTARAPFLLGRTDFLDRFVLTIDQAQRKIVLTEHP